VHKHHDFEGEQKCLNSLKEYINSLSIDGTFDTEYAAALFAKEKGMLTFVLVEFDSDGYYDSFRTVNTKEFFSPIEEAIREIIREDF